MTQFRERPIFDTAAGRWTERPAKHTCEIEVPPHALFAGSALRASASTSSLPTLISRINAPPGPPYLARKPQDKSPSCSSTYSSARANSARELGGGGGDGMLPQGARGQQRRFSLEDARRLVASTSTDRLLPKYVRKSTSERSTPLMPVHEGEKYSRPFCSYDKACHERRILPKFLRAVQEGILGKELDISGLSVGDLQLEAILSDKSLLPCFQVVRWRLRDIRLTAAGVPALTDRLPWQTDVLDISHNDIGNRGIEPLCFKMSEARLPKIRVLDFSAIGLTCSGVSTLCDSLDMCPFLLRLELSHNAIKDGTALGAFVMEHTSIVRLTLTGNFLTGKGSTPLFEGVLENSRRGGHLASLDLAWNPLSHQDGMAAAEAISALLSESTVLYHLDLSYANFDTECCAEIGKGLRDNHHLYGLHLVGNKAIMDADGFLQPLDPESVAAPPPPGAPDGEPASIAENCVATTEKESSGSAGPTTGTATRRRRSSLSGCIPCPPSDASRGGRGDEPDMAYTDDDVLRDRDVLEQQSTCWACEGWARVELEWMVPPGEPEPKAVFAFTSLDWFRSALRLKRLECAEEPGRIRFTAARMVPGGCALLCIFQVDSRLRIPPGAEKERLKTPAPVRMRICEEHPILGVDPHQECREVASLKTPVRGHADATVQGRRVVILDGPDGCPMQKLRVTETEFRLKVEPPREKAFFQAYRHETKKVLDDCLALDWSRAKVGRIIVETERSAVQSVLEKHYRSIVAIYRYMSTLGGPSDMTFGVSQIEMSDFISQAGLVDGKVTRIADIDRLFIAAKVMNVEMKRGLAVRSDKALVRHQFLEFLLRLAHQRFVQTGEEHLISEALARLLKALSKANQARIAELDAFLQKLHTEQVDDVYRRHGPALEAIYRKYSGRRTPPGQPSFMAYIEFQELLDLLNAYDTEFVRSRAGFAFRLGMMTQSEESYSSRFQEMSFLEFQHAMGAVVYLRAQGREGPLADLIDAFFTASLPTALHT